DGIRVFHVTGVQTCALPISDCDPSVRAQEIKNSHLVLCENQSARLLLGEARRHKRRHDERSREYLANHVNATTADGGEAPRVVTPVSERAVDPRLWLQKRLRRTDQYSRHVRAAQYVRVAKVGKEHRVATKHISKGKIVPSGVLIQFRSNRILGPRCLADRIVDGVLLLMAVH